MKRLAIRYRGFIGVLPGKLGFSKSIPVTKPAVETFGRKSANDIENGMPLLASLRF